MLLFDPLYWMIVGPAMLFALFAQAKVKGTFARYLREPNMRGMAGAQAAAAVLDAAGIQGIGIEEHQGYLSDHYDPKHKVLRLSSDVYHGRSIASIGVAAHEAGHAIQDAQDYLPLNLRAASVPLASFGSMLAIPLIFFGFFIGALGLVKLGIVAFSAVVGFQLITLPVEFDASRRAKQILLETGIVSGPESTGVAKVLSAAAMTYVAATIQAVAQLAYFVMLASGRDD